MPSSPSGSPDESYFNDLSQQPSNNSTSQNGSKTGTSNGDAAPESEAQARPKRIACVLCRKRKLRCDGARPACGTCKRLSHDCAYDEVRKKSGPKRGYVKLLEARLQQVETLLKNQDPMGDVQRKGSDDALPQSFTIPTRPIVTSAPSTDTINVNLSNIDPQLLPPGTGATTDSFLGVNMGASMESHGGEDQFSWEMIGLGLEEPLPLQETINELHRIFFEKIHPSMPIVHRPRYLAAMNLAPQMRPPVGLRYMMWCMAASVTDKYEAMQEHFYHRARKYLQMDEMRGHGEATITIGTCQAWLLVSMHEFKLMYFPRAWMSVGRACRLALMMGLHRLDGAGLDVKQCIPPPRDWTEREERRRTFWMAFCEDRYASIGTGWPMIVDERDIMTNLPAAEDAFDKSKPMPTTTLAEVTKPGGAAQLSQFGGVVLMACLFGRNLTHLHRPTQEDQDDNLEGAFWQRHRDMEGILANTGLSLPDHLRLPAGLPDPNVIFLNMNIHTSAICLHQAAIFKADRYKLPANVGSESRVRCMTAAAEIARIMRMLVHLDLSSMNPFISFCLYVAARVFVQYLKFRPKDQQMISSLQFLLTAMQALKRKNPLTESFIVQLDLDLAGAGIDVGQPKLDYYNNNIVVSYRQNMYNSAATNEIIRAKSLKTPIP
ncbi:hypothetical protein NA57DRAFT_49185 [Rhizodiscina lignyota]|uniref:Zn(2)-C6 fungal-type domain-containing protein n=1 Tax=Rhizodiscina lignyota TaxID=1504668 RepID=A0A9P4I6S6_9PEZI|nr:hypothetical protein NA57DRAFT_49185 [Rhizodiscina lignyota]